MHRIMVVLVALLSLSTTLAVAAPTKALGKLSNTRIVRADQNKSIALTYAGVRILVPAGHIVILAQAEDGSIVVRAQQLNGVEVGTTTLHAQGPVTVSVAPDTQIVTVYSGKEVKVTDANGRTAELAQGASVSGKDIRASVITALNTGTTTTQTETPYALPTFVAETETTSAAAEQATQDVEETLSPSAPR